MPIDFLNPLADNSLNSGLVSWWLPLGQLWGSGALWDLATRNHGGLVNLPSWQSGLFQQAGSVAFTAASSQYASLITTSSLSPSSGMTIAGWLRRNGTSALEQHVLTNWYQGDGNLNGYLFNWMDTAGGVANRMRFFIGNGTPTYSGRPIFSSAITDSDWHFVVGTWDGSTAVMYLEGVVDAGAIDSAGAPVSSVSVSGINYHASQVCRIADVNTGSEGGYFNGTVGSLSLYNRALSATEVRSLWNQGRQGFPDILRQYRRQRTLLLRDSGGEVADPFPAWLGTRQVFEEEFEYLAY